VFSLALISQLAALRLKRFSQNLVKTGGTWATEETSRFWW